MVYVYAPRWTDSSAGIRALHFLCHSLNKIGIDAFLVFSDSKKRGVDSVSEYLLTPVLTESLAKAHFHAGRKPIVVYSETVPGNPLNASRVIRYLMNYVGDLGGQKSFDDNEYIVAFSQNIANRYAKEHEGHQIPDVLFLPPVDPRPFKYSVENREDFYLLYAGKYRAFVGPPPALKNRKVIEVLRHGRGAQSRNEVIELLSRCRAVISMENSSIITEAILSGAPGLFLPNPFLLEAIAEQELGWHGTAWGIDLESEEKARSTTLDGRSKYLEKCSEFPDRLLEVFEAASKQLISNREEEPLTIPKSYRLFSQHKLGLSIQVITTLGFRSFVRVVRNYLARRLSGRF